MSKFLLLAGVAFVAFAPAAHALTFEAKQTLIGFTAPGGTETTIALQGVNTSPPFNTLPISTADYTISFTGLTVPQGVVQGDSPNVRAIPVAGGTTTTPTYLTGDVFGTLPPFTTTSTASSGKYLSTGTNGGTITITFTTPKSSLALLWGSVDASNQIKVNNEDGTTETLTGLQVINKALLPAPPNDGNRDFGGSAYVALTSGASTGFRSVSFSSGVISFEAAAITGIAGPRLEVPEPMSIALLGLGLAALGVVRRRAA